jgi:hypothetical protein
MAELTETPASPGATLTETSATPPLVDTRLRCSFCRLAIPPTERQANNAPRTAIICAACQKNSLFSTPTAQLKEELRQKRAKKIQGGDVQHGDVPNKGHFKPALVASSWFKNCSTCKQLAHLDGSGRCPACLEAEGTGSPSETNKTKQCFNCERTLPRKLFANNQVRLVGLSLSDVGSVF